MTCKDCVHQEACFDWCRGFVEITELCEHFKDKSKFIGLPCKVGDTVYVVMPELYGDQIIKAFVNEIILNHGETKMLVYYELHQNGRIHTLYISFFGKTVFLTYEAAEAALKEREQNE